MSWKVPEDTDYKKSTILKVKIGDHIYKRELRHNYDCTYKHLIEVVQGIICINPDNIVSLKYRDNENDWITLADDFDVNFAFRHEPTLLIAVNLASNDQSTQPPDQAIVSGHGHIDLKSLTSPSQVSAVSHNQLTQRLLDLSIAMSSSSYNQPPRAIQTTAAGYGASPPQSLYQTTTSSSAGGVAGQPLSPTANFSPMQYGVPPTALFAPVNPAALTHRSEAAAVSVFKPMRNVLLRRQTIGGITTQYPQTGDVDRNPFASGAPGSHLQQPGSYQQQPGSHQQQPGSYQQQLGSHQQQPGSHQQQPGSSLSGSYYQ